MNHPRDFANAVTLPTGQDLILGGQTYGATFTDNAAVTVPEIWNPETNTFTDLADSGFPRTYHSVGILLPDGTVFSGGGGLCDFCGDQSHPDGQIFTPPYLLQADSETPAARPEIVGVSEARVRVGGELVITVGSVGADVEAVLIRLGTTTHTVDTDSRRVPLTAASTYGGRHTYTLPGDAGVLLLGYHHLFVLSGGVSSVARMIKVDL